MADTGRLLIIAGILLVVTGIVFSMSGKIPFLGRLPGDIAIERENVSFYFPIATSIILSILLTIILNFFLRK